MKVYVDSKYIPEKCNKCKFIGHYEDGIYSRNPHCCCELYWDLCQDEIRVDKNSRDKNCPLQSLSDHDKQVRKEVQVLKNLICKTRNILHEILIVGNRPVKNTSKEDCYTVLSKLQDLYKSNMITSNEWFLDQIQGEDK